MGDHHIIWTDGSCLKNPYGPGGWAWVNETTMEQAAGFSSRTTNNRMELSAILQALKMTPPGRQIRVYSDSTYAVKGMTTWRAGWIKKQFRGIKNVDLWQALYKAEAPHGRVEYMWRRGHNGDRYNEIADRLAWDAARSQQALDRSKMDVVVVGRVACQQDVASAAVEAMEARLGRRLLRDEMVHHIDGDPQNIDYDNLALVTRAGHARLHRREEILAGQLADLELVQAAREAGL